MIGIGQVIGNYRIIAKLGSGGMGVVYLAEHPHIGKRVALKVIHRELSSNQEVVARFFNEARAVNAIGNAHIVEIVDFGQTQEGEFFLIMELLQGEGLEIRLKRERIDQQSVLHIADQIAFALEATHAAGYIHRDIKPDNIFLTVRGNDRNFVKLLDFGLVKHMTSGGGAALTQQGVILGTPTYMAPEQCESRQVDYRADIYSLGILMYEMLAGRAPFVGQSAGDIMVQQVAQPPMPLSQVVQGMSPSVDKVVLRCLAKKPGDRFQSMGELRVALRDPDGYARNAPPVPIPQPVGYGGYSGQQQQPQAYPQQAQQAAAAAASYGQAAQQAYGGGAYGAQAGAAQQQQPQAMGAYGAGAAQAAAQPQQPGQPATAGPAQKTMFVDAQSPMGASAGGGGGGGGTPAHFIQGQGAASAAQKTMFLDGPPVLPTGANGSAMPPKPALPSKPVAVVAPPPRVSTPPKKSNAKVYAVVGVLVVGGGIAAAIGLSGGGGDKKAATADAGVSVATERIAVELKTDPEGADILVGNVNKGKTNQRIMLPKGQPCEITLRLSEYKEHKLKLACTGNESPALIKLELINPDPAVSGSAPPAPSPTAAAAPSPTAAAAPSPTAEPSPSPSAAAAKPSPTAEPSPSVAAAGDKTLEPSDPPKKKNGGGTTKKKKKGDGTMKPSFD